jgi:HEAT repeat protein
VQALVATGQPDVVLPLLGRVDDPDPAVREQILAGLSLLGDERATLPLIGKLQDQRPGVRAGAARALGSLKDTRAIAALLLAQGDSESEVRVAVVGALAQLQAVSAVPSLIALRRDSHDEALDRAILAALVEMNSVDAATVVVQAVADEALFELPQQTMQRASASVVEALQHCLAGQPSERVGNACALTLARIGHPRLNGVSAALFLGALERGSVSKAVALQVFGQLRMVAALPTALALLEDLDPLVRQQAADLVAQLLDPHRPDGTAVDPLLTALSRAHDSPRLQRTLLVALGHTRSPRAAAALLPYLRQERPIEQRLAAIEALGLVAGPGGAAALLPLLDDGDSRIRLEAALALRRSGGSESFAALWQRSTRAPAQDREAVALALAGPLRAAKTPVNPVLLIRHIQASRGSLRDALLESVSFMPSTSGIAVLQQLSGTGDAATLAKVAEVAAGYQASAAKLLSRLATDANSTVRANAAWSLGEAGEAALQTLLLLVQDPDHAIAGNAVASLARVHPNPAQLAAMLCGFIGDPRVYVRFNALNGLRLRGMRCMEGNERRVLVNDPSASVRLGAARLIADVASADLRQDRVALAGCSRQEVDQDVAEACEIKRPSSVASAAARSAAAPVGAAATSDVSEAVTVFVLPRGGGEPLAQAPFALATSQGFIRSGWTDRRGAVFQRDSAAPRLVVPPPFVTVE